MIKLTGWNKLPVFVNPANVAYVRKDEKGAMIAFIGQTNVLYVTESAEQVDAIFRNAENQHIACVEVQGRVTMLKE